MSFRGAWLLHNLPVPLLLQHPAWSAGQVPAAGEISEREGCSGAWMKFPETLVPPDRGAGGKAERFEAHGNW